MKDISNDCLLNNYNYMSKKNNMISFESISEKQEESSNSSNKNSKIMKSRATLKKNNISLRGNENSKDGINMSIISMKNRLSRNLIQDKRKTFMITRKRYDEKDQLKPIKRTGKIKKRSQILSNKRISLQHDTSQLFSNQLKMTEEVKFKRSSSKNLERNENNNMTHINSITNINRTVLKEKTNFNKMLSCNQINRLSSLQKKNSFIEKSGNSGSDYLDDKYFSTKKMRKTVLRKDKLNLKDTKNVNSTNLFEKLKESYLFEKSENLLFKIKICYIFLGFFSFMSILLGIIDAIIFNKKTKTFFEDNYNIYLNNETDNDISHYHFVETRVISKSENRIRITNIIFSIFCFLLHIIIHYIKNFTDKSQQRNKKYNYYKYYNKKRKASKYGIQDPKNNIINSESHIKFIMNEDFASKNYVSDEEIIKLVINCVISLIFYPPGINKVFIGIRQNTKYMYSLNSIFLIFTILKMKNIYFTFYYLSPFNNLLYKIICSSNMIKMDFKFMFRFLLNLYPLSFIFINFLIIVIIFSILIYCIEYFSIDINTVYNNKGKNDINDLYCLVFLLFTYVTKTINGDIKPETVLGSFMLVIGGSLGILIIFYLIYYLNQLLEFKQDEQQAYSKLVKLLNPINNEHKASNLIKMFILYKKNCVDNQNIEQEYRIKKDNNIKNIIQRNFFGIRRSNFNFAPNDSNNSLINIMENGEYKEKKNFLKFISSQFILKTKLINEFKNFKNNLLIARNNSLPFNDVLKTLGEKMNGNIAQLNNKLEKLMQNDEKYKNFMKFQFNSLKKIKKIKGYQEYIINYLIDKNNITNVEYLKEIRENINNFKNLGKIGSGVGGGPKRIRSSFNGNFFAFNKRKTRKGSLEEPTKKVKIKQHSKEIEKVKSPGVKRLRSSVFGKNSILNNNESRAETNPGRKLNKNKNKNKHKSFDESALKVSKKRKKDRAATDIIEDTKNKCSSLSIKKKNVINKMKTTIENKILGQ